MLARVPLNILNYPKKGEAVTEREPESLRFCGTSTPWNTNFQPSTGERELNHD